MKYLFVFLAFVALAYADGDWVPKTDDQVKVIRDECLKEVPLTEEQVTKIKQFEYPDEEAVRKYILCAVQKIGIFSKHEGYHADRIASQYRTDLGESEVLAIIEGCIDKNDQGSPTDVWAFRGHKCFMASKVGEKVKSYIKKRQEEATKSAA